jgi:LPXTG-motif cell wall-anchored protein
MKWLRVGLAVGRVMVKRGFVLVLLMTLAQPAAATQMVNLASSERATAPAACAAQDPACTAGGGASETDSSDAGPIIAGLLGLLVLGAVFGRRKNGLPEVVS